ncbi:hypothetical protein ACTFIV_006941, partial [Dictyostelium citrinum]
FDSHKEHVVPNTGKKQKKIKRKKEMTVIAIKIMNIVIGGGILGVILMNKIMPKQENQRIFLLGIQVILLVLSGVMLIGFEGSDIINKISPYISMVTVYSNNANINIGYNVDGISAIFIVLTIVLILSCILISLRVIKEKQEKQFHIMLLITEILIINFFAATDLVQLYIVYEASLIPMVIMIGVWGSRTEKKIAAFQILIYTLIGSIFMLMSIGLLYSTLGTTDYILIREYIEVLPENVRKIIFIGFFIGFAVKIPIAPLHLWLLRAHVEAPTAGSVLLAGILLKLGGYGYIRYNIGLFPDLCEYYFPIIGGICLISILYTGIATLTQLDVKRIVAYSSISHMIIFALLLFWGATFANLKGVRASSILSWIGAVFGTFIPRIITVGGLGSLATWIMGPAKGLIAAAKEEDLPQFLRGVNGYGVPKNFLVLQASIVSLLSVAFLFLPSINIAYWVFLVLTTQLYLTMYFLLFGAVLKLRNTHPKIHRPFQIPGGKIGLWGFTMMGLMSTAFALIVAFLPPSQIPENSRLFFTTSLMIAMIGFICLPFGIALEKSLLASLSSHLNRAYLYYQALPPGSVATVLTETLAIEATVRVGLGCLKLYSKEYVSIDQKLERVMSQDILTAIFYGVCAASSSTWLKRVGSICLIGYSLILADGKGSGLYSPYFTSQILYRPVRFTFTRLVSNPLKNYFFSHYPTREEALMRYGLFLKKSVKVVSVGVCLGVAAWKISRYLPYQTLFSRFFT